MLVLLLLCLAVVAMTVAFLRKPGPITFTALAFILGITAIALYVWLGGPGGG